MAFNGPDAKEWKRAVTEEMDAIYAADTLSEPVVLPKDVKATSLKFIFAKKVGNDGMVSQFKARLVYNHCVKKNDEENNYAPVANRVSLRIFLGAVATHKWELVQADVKTTFLNADNPGLEYVHLPCEVVEDDTQRIRILKKALYGLQRAPKMWHLTFSNWAIQQRFIQNQHDSCLFMHSSKDRMLIIYVDDMLMAAQTKELLEQMCLNLMTGFSQEFLENLPIFLG
jgi:hypothetical protein